MAGEIAETAEFFSFGTNDLTQTTFGISRDDAASFLGTYVAKGILADRPVRRRSTAEGVGELIQHRRPSAAARRAPTLKLGICGEHGGDPASVSVLRRAWASTTCPARRSACRSPGWPPRRRRWPARPEALPSPDGADPSGDDSLGMLDSGPASAIRGIEDIPGKAWPICAWRRFVEMVSLDRPWVGELFMRKRHKPIVPASVEKWDREYREGVYDRLARSTSATIIACWRP